MLAQTCFADRDSSAEGNWHEGKGGEDEKEDGARREGKEQGASHAGEGVQGMEFASKTQFRLGYRLGRKPCGG